MKKRIISIGIIALVLLFFGPMTVFAQTASDAYFKIFSSGTYHMKAQMTVDGQTADMESYMKDGMIATSFSSQGESNRMIFRDNKMYMIMDAVKMVMIMPGGDTSDAHGVETDDMKLTGSGRASFGGKNLPYDEYRDPDGNKAQFFMDGAKFAGIRNISTEGENIDLIISVLDQNVPNNVFNIPTGYQVQDMSAFGKF